MSKNKIYFGVGEIPKGKRRGTAKEAVAHRQIRYYGVKKVNKNLLSKAKLLRLLNKTSMARKLEKMTIAKYAYRRIEKEFNRLKNSTRTEDIKKVVKIRIKGREAFAKWQKLKKEYSILTVQLAKLKKDLKSIKSKKKTKSKTKKKTKKKTKSKTKQKTKKKTKQKTKTKTKQKTKTRKRTKNKTKKRTKSKTKNKTKTRKRTNSKTKKRKTKK